MAVSMAAANFVIFSGLRIVENRLFNMRIPRCFFQLNARRCRVLPRRRMSPSVAAKIPHASTTALEDGSSTETDKIPTPKVIIDQDADPNATVVEITFGDRLGALLDTG